MNSIAYNTVNDKQDSHKHKYMKSEMQFYIYILSHFLLEQNAAKSKVINKKHTQSR